MDKIIGDGLDALRKALAYGRTQPNMQCPSCKGTGEDSEFEGSCFLCEGLGVKCRE